MNHPKHIQFLGIIQVQIEPHASRVDDDCWLDLCDQYSSFLNNSESYGKYPLVSRVNPKWEFVQHPNQKKLYDNSSTSIISELFSDESTPVQIARFAVPSTSGTLHFILATHS